MIAFPSPKTDGFALQGKPECPESVWNSWKGHWKAEMSLNMDCRACAAGSKDFPQPVPEIKRIHLPTVTGLRAEKSAKYSHFIGFHHLFIE